MPGVKDGLPDKVLVVRLGAIGDVVNAQVVANAIKEARPKTQVGWVAHDLVQPLLEGHPAVDRAHLWRRGKGLRGMLEVARELRAEGYELALDLQRIAKSGLLARLCGARCIVGFDRARSKELGWVCRARARCTSYPTTRGPRTGLRPRWSRWVSLPCC